MFISVMQYLRKERTWNSLMLLALMSLVLLAYITHDINFPFDLGTYTRALYVDEGFYSDAAQNLVKTGAWEMLHDSRHWPGSPLSLVLQSLAFSLFGASVEVARMLSVTLGALGAWALYSIAKVRFSPWISALLVISTISTISYVAVARAAVTDPMAMVMFLLAVWVFVSMENRARAIPLSLIFAFLAFFAKMYFIFALATVITLWLGELIFVPLLNRRKIDSRLLNRVWFSLAGLALFYLAYRFHFQDQISAFLAINANKKPTMELAQVLQMQWLSILLLPRHTKSLFFLYTLGFAGMLASLYILLGWWQSVSGRRVALPRFQASINRAEWAMGLFLVSGMLTVGMLGLIKSHYQFFAIIPIVFLAIAATFHVLPRVLATIASAVVLLVHMYFQLPAYQAWMARPEGRLIDSQSRKIAAIVEQTQAQGLIPVIGEYSAQLGLYSKRITSIDAKWVSQTQLCQRLEHWKPPYHVNVVWNKSSSSAMLESILACPNVSMVDQPVLFTTFSGKKDYIALTRLSYESTAVKALQAPLSLLLQ